MSNLNKIKQISSSKTSSLPFPLSRASSSSPSQHSKLASTRISSRSNYNLHYEDKQVLQYYNQLTKYIENTLSVYYSRFVYKHVSIDEEDELPVSFHVSPDFHYLLCTHTSDSLKMDQVHISHIVVNTIQQTIVAEYKAIQHMNTQVTSGVLYCEWDLSKNSTLRITEFEQFTYKKKPIVERRFGIYPANTHSFFMKTMTSLKKECSIATIKDLLQIIYIYAYA